MRSVVAGVVHTHTHIYIYILYIYTYMYIRINGASSLAGRGTQIEKGKGTKTGFELYGAWLPSTSFIQRQVVEIQSPARAKERSRGCYLLRLCVGRAFLWNEHGEHNEASIACRVIGDRDYWHLSRMDNAGQRGRDFLNSANGATKLGP